MNQIFRVKGVVSGNLPTDENRYLILTQVISCEAISGRDIQHNLNSIFPHPNMVKFNFANCKQTLVSCFIHLEIDNENIR